MATDDPIWDERSWPPTIVQSWLNLLHDPAITESQKNIPSTRIASAQIFLMLVLRIGGLAFTTVQHALMAETQLSSWLTVIIRRHSTRRNAEMPEFKVVPIGEAMMSATATAKGSQIAQEYARYIGRLRADEAGRLTPSDGEISHLRHMASQISRHGYSRAPDLLIRGPRVPRETVRQPLSTKYMHDQSVRRLTLKTGRGLPYH